MAFLTTSARNVDLVKRVPSDIRLSRAAPGLPFRGRRAPCQAGLGTLALRPERIDTSRLNRRQTRRILVKKRLYASSSW